MKTRFNQHNSDIHTQSEKLKGTTLSAYVRNLIRNSIPHNIKWEMVKRAAPFNPHASERFETFYAHDLSMFKI